MKTVGHLMPGELQAAVEAAGEREEDQARERVERSIDWDNTGFDVQGDWVVLTQEIPPEFTAGGLVIPDTARDKHHGFPIVVEAGPDAGDLKPGEQVVMTSNVGIPPADYCIIVQPRGDQRPIMAVRLKYIVTRLNIVKRHIKAPSEVLQ